jgi:S1-C subfamily serine protease
MTSRHSRIHKLCAWLTVAIAIGVHPGIANAGSLDIFKSSVVKIHVTSQRNDYMQPWQSARISGGTGSGFIISGKRILTNAHVVSDARTIEVQKHNDARRYKASVKFIGHDCDLAMLEVLDPSFFNGTREMSISRRLPELDDEVVAMGYPMGGNRISITRGVVSRIDYSTYSHSGSDEHLVLQVDAAINPGNSGGPVLLDNKVIGVAFQGLTAGDNIGYAIPTPVIHHFLDDTKDGTYNGYPELGAWYVEMHNAGLRKHHNLGKNDSGVLVYYVDPFGAAHGHVINEDILLSIDGYNIANDGTVSLDNNQVLFAELLERKQWGDTIVLDLLRDGKKQTIIVPLKNKPDPFVYKNVYDERPEYTIVAGLVFSPLNYEQLKSMGRNAPRQARQQLLYYSQYAKLDKLIGDREEFVIMVNRLPHPINTYHENFLYDILVSVNNKPINKLEDISPALKSPINGFHIFKFQQDTSSLVISAEDANQAEAAILEHYGIPEKEYYDK